MKVPEYGCDRCGEYVPNGAGRYHDDERLCTECHEVAHADSDDAYNRRETPGSVFFGQF